MTCRDNGKDDPPWKEWTKDGSASIETTLASLASLLFLLFWLPLGRKRKNRNLEGIERIETTPASLSIYSSPSCFSSTEVFSSFSSFLAPKEDALNQGPWCIEPKTNISCHFTGQIVCLIWSWLICMYLWCMLHFDDLFKTKNYRRSSGGTLRQKKTQLNLNWASNSIKQHQLA